jgi:predicted nucleic acid-binding protein
MLVLDSSAALAWVLDDESTAIGSLESLLHERVTVPAHWILEVTNGLKMAIQRGRLKPSDRGPIMERLAILPIKADPETSVRGWQEIPALADKYGLTSYDASYVELALRLDVPLVTLDRALARAARAAGVTLFE